MDCRSSREIVSSCAALPCQSENHVLCRTCVLTTNTEQCCHKTDKEWDFTGTWFIDEVRLAVQKWYIVLEIHEVYEYDTKYDPETREGGLFAGYIDTYLN